MGGFYETENLGNFVVNNPQVTLQQSSQDFRQYQYHQFGIQSAYPEIVLNQTYSSGAPRVLTLDEVINGCKLIIKTPAYTGAFIGLNEVPNAFNPAAVKRYYVNYLPSSLTANTGTKYPSDYAVLANFGFKNFNGFRYYNLGNPVDTLAAADESHLWGIPKGFGIGPSFDVGRGTEILLLWNNPYKAGQPLEARFLLRNAFDWTSASIAGGAGLLAPYTGNAYKPNLAPFQADLVPDPDGEESRQAINGVILVPAAQYSAQWYY
jgi:hypothetical protein